MPVKPRLLHPIYPFGRCCTLTNPLLWYPSAPERPGFGRDVGHSRGLGCSAWRLHAPTNPCSDEAEDMYGEKAIHGGYFRRH